MNARPKAAPASPSFSVDGFHVLITGGCGGIGAAIAHGFAAHGAKVTLADLKTPPTDCTIDSGTTIARVHDAISYSTPPM